MGNETITLILVLEIWIGNVSANGSMSFFRCSVVCLIFFFFIMDEINLLLLHIQLLNNRHNTETRKFILFCAALNISR